VDLLNVSILVSSTKPITVVAPAFSYRRRVEAKKRKRIGDRVEPWGIPDVVDRILSSKVPSVRVIVRSLKKERMYSATHCGSLASLILWISLSWETLSNTPEMSRLSMLATSVGSFDQTVRICSVSISSAVIVDRPGRAPICVVGSRSCSSAKVDNRQATIFSSTFPSVFSRAIGLYAFAILYTGFYGFLRTTVLEWRKGVG
jgi:hypothetical protein